MLHHVFDMDGVLVDSKDAVIETYRRAGTDAAASNWGRPWRGWVSPEVHELKGRLYPEVLMDLGRPGPMLGTFKRLLNAGDDLVLVATGASWASITAVARFLHTALPVYIAEADADAKRAALLELQDRPTFAGGFYYDDDAVAGRMITAGTTFELKTCAAEDLS